MPFTVRIVLHDGESEDYDKLHEEMDSKGFLDYYESKTHRYELPPAEYNYPNSGTKESVLEKAENAAKETGKDFQVLVTESAGRISTGLNKVKK